jgi:hypothetical protein
MKKNKKVLFAVIVLAFIHCAGIYADPIDGKWVAVQHDISPHGYGMRLFMITMEMTLFNGELVMNMSLYDPVSGEVLSTSGFQSTFVYSNNTVIASYESGGGFTMDYDERQNTLTIRNEPGDEERIIFRPFVDNTNVRIMSTTARELLTDFSNNAVAARRKWSDQTVIFSGRIAEIFENSGIPYLRIVDGVHSGTYIHCRLAPNDLLLYESKIGDTVILQGLIGNYEISTSLQWNYLLRVTECVIIGIE